MGIPIFLSYPKPHTSSQDVFVNRLRDQLKSRELDSKTLGVNEYDTDAPLSAIRRLMLESNGLITVAFRRTFVESGVSRRGADLTEAQETSFTNVWFTSPYSQIEPAMAFQLGLPIMILREHGVVAEGVLEKGVVGLYMPEFSLEPDGAEYLGSKEWQSLAAKWEQQVRSVRESKGRPPQLFQ